ncbi:MAG: NAD(P)H-hydrate epimerase [Halobacteriales archaeon]|jgi:NAD(P)H-hydrate epimerase
MPRSSFRTPGGREVTAVTASEMRAVDRVAVEEVGLELLQMMENVGRVLAWHVRDVRDARTEDGEVVVVAGNGGNGGGGMACARHLANRDVTVRVLLDRSPGELTGAAAHQARILEAMAVPRTTDADGLFDHEGPIVLVDALVGYGLSGEVRHPAREYVDRVNHRPDPVVSLDVPSGRDATTGETRGAAVTPDRTVTLALPKTGLDGATGALYLADIGIPGTAYDRLDVDYDPPFDDHDWVELER